jgi:hypothetical protein
LSALANRMSIQSCDLTKSRSSARRRHATPILGQRVRIVAVDLPVPFKIVEAAVLKGMTRESEMKRKTV